MMLLFFPCNKISEYIHIYIHIYMHVILLPVPRNSNQMITTNFIITFPISELSDFESVENYYLFLFLTSSNPVFCVFILLYLFLCSIFCFLFLNVSFYYSRIFTFVNIASMIFMTE